MNIFLVIGCIIAIALCAFVFGIFVGVIYQFWAINVILKTEDITMVDGKIVYVKRNAIPKT